MLASDRAPGGDQVGDSGSGNSRTERSVGLGKTAKLAASHLYLDFVEQSPEIP